MPARKQESNVVAVVAVVDTNIWVSAFLNPRGFPARLVEAGKTDQLTVVMSPPMLEELMEVLCRPRIMKIRRTTVADAEAFVRGVAEVARLVSVSGDLRLCRDPDDDVVLETAVVGGAQYAVSRDEDITRDLELTRRLAERSIEPITVSRLLELWALEA